MWTPLPQSNIFPHFPIKSLSPNSLCKLVLGFGAISVFAGRCWSATTGHHWLRGPQLAFHFDKLVLKDPVLDLGLVKESFEVLNRASVLFLPFLSDLFLGIDDCVGAFLVVFVLLARFDKHAFQVRHLQVALVLQSLHASQLAQFQARNVGCSLLFFLSQGGRQFFQTLVLGEQVFILTHVTLKFVVELVLTQVRLLFSRLALFNLVLQLLVFLLKESDFLIAEGLLLTDLLVVRLVLLAGLSFETAPLLTELAALHLQTVSLAGHALERINGVTKFCAHLTYLV